MVSIISGHHRTTHMTTFLEHKYQHQMQLALKGRGACIQLMQPIFLVYTLPQQWNDHSSSKHYSKFKFTPY